MTGLLLCGTENELVDTVAAWALLLAEVGVV